MRITLFFIIGATVFALGESLKCYDCIDSDSNVPIQGKEKCKKPFSSSDDNHNCTDGYYCMKGIASIEEISATVRGCITPNIPNLDPNDLPDFPDPMEMPMGPLKLTAYLCKTDFCNSASLPTTTVPFLILFLVTLFFV